MEKLCVNAATMAFIGDAVFELKVRTKLAFPEKPLKKLHKQSVDIVNATAQAKAFTVIEPFLTEEEMNIFKRGRNLKVTNIPKNSSVAEYHTATGLETIFGFLHLEGREDRIQELFDIIWNNKNG